VGVVPVLPAIDGEPTYFSYQAAAAPVDAYTVPADTVLLLTHANISVYHAAGVAAYGYVCQRVGGVNVWFFTWIDSLTTYTAANMVSQNYWPAIPIVAGTIIRLYTNSANFRVQFDAFGYLCAV